MGRVIYLTSNTSIETDWKCGMARWWYKEEGGNGIVPVSEPAYFKEGRQIHEDLAELAGVEDDKLGEWLSGKVNSLILEATDAGQIGMEIATRRAGWVVGAALYIEPQTRAEFDTVATELEIVLDADPLWVASTPDRVLRRKVDGLLVDRDYKSVKRVSKGWAEYWGYAAQLQSQIKAIEDEYQTKVAYAQIMGLFKGEDRDGKLRHPYVWAYTKGDPADPENWTGEYKYGLTLTPVWEYPLGITEWVRKLGPEVAAGIFPFSRPVYFDERKLQDLIASRTHREQEVHAIREVAQVDRHIRAEYFEPRYSQCSPVFGSQCAYLAACHNATVNADPVGSGLYVPKSKRELNEVVELEMLARGDDDN